MKKQNICIIGGGLTGLITAITLSKLNLNIDLITGDINQSIKSNRTTAISQANYNYLKRLEIFKSLENEFWPCDQMKLYTENKSKQISKILEVDNKKKKILYMVKNSQIIKKIIKDIKKKKIVNLKTNNTVSKVLNSGVLKSVVYNNHNKHNKNKYNLIIVCSGNNSNLVRSIFNDQFFDYSYGEQSITTVVGHDYLKNNIARQIFLDNEIIAFLPISNTRTSIVWSVNKNLIDKYKKKQNFIFKKKLKFYTKGIMKNVKCLTDVHYNDLSLMIRKKYYDGRVLLFGDALHVVHPLAGQGFNMILRDLETLEKIIKNKINLGLDVGSTDILDEISQEIKPRNLIYSLGVDIVKNIFSLKNYSFKDFRNKAIKELNKNNFIKNKIFKLADRGLRF